MTSIRIKGEGGLAGVERPHAAVDGVGAGGKRGRERLGTSGGREQLGAARGAKVFGDGGHMLLSAGH